MTEEDVRELVRQRSKLFARNRNSSGFTEWCAQAGVNKGHASDFMNGKKLPGTDLLDALGLEWAIVQKKGKPNA